MTKSISLYKVLFCFLFISWLAPNIAWCDPGPMDKLLLKPNLQKPNTLDETGAICSGISAMNALDEIKGILVDLETVRQDVFTNYSNTLGFLEDQVEVSLERPLISSYGGVHDAFGDLIHDLIRKTAHPKTDGKLIVLKSNTDFFVSKLNQLDNEVRMLKELCGPQ